MEEVLTRWPDVFVNIDTKSDAVVEPLVDLVRGVDAFDRVCIGSFRDERLRRVRRLAGGASAPRWDRPGSPPRGWPRGPVACRGSRQIAYRCRVRARRLVVVDRRFIEAAQGAGLQVHVWTTTTSGRWPSSSTSGSTRS